MRNVTPRIARETSTLKYIQTNYHAEEYLTQVLNLGVKDIPLFATGFRRYSSQGYVPFISQTANTKITLFGND